MAGMNEAKIWQKIANIPLYNAITQIFTISKYFCVSYREHKKWS